MKSGRFHELMPFAGQSSGAISSILPAADVMRSIALEAEELLRGAAYRFVA